MFVGQEFLHGDMAGLTTETRLLELNIIDSLGIITLLAFIENELGVIIPPEDVEPANLQSVKAIAAVVDARRRPRTS